MSFAKPIAIGSRPFLPRVGSLVLKIGPVRKLWHLIERFPPFFAIFFSSKGIGCHTGRLLVWGKMRRFTISLIPPLARYLQKYYGTQGGCSNCGTSCNLLCQCPHWDKSSRLCTVYEDRPNICKTFPITPADVRDRNLVEKQIGCGFSFTQANSRSMPVPRKFHRAPL